MNASIQKEAKELEGWDGQAEAHSIYEAMQQLKDRRRKQGKRYAIALIMTYLLLAKAAGETTLQATSEWIRLRGAWSQEVLPQAGPYFPCAATYSNVLRAVDHVQLNAVLMDLLTRARAHERKEGEQEHVALDGKTLRGTQGYLPEDHAVDASGKFVRNTDGNCPSRADCGRQRKRFEPYPGVSDAPAHQRAYRER